jgi:multicomponent Na+:H+ antiporter subunit E
MEVEQSSLSRRVPRGFLFLWLLLTFLWFAANSSLEIESLVTGGSISAALAYLFASRTDVWQGIHFSPARLLHFILYLSILVKEMVRANINMLRYVYAPRRPTLSPGIVTIKTALKSPVGRLALANSIALTPGSLVMDVQGDTLFIHCLDVVTTDPDQAGQLIAGPFEELLEKTFD